MADAVGNDIADTLRRIEAVLDDRPSVCLRDYFAARVLSGAIGGNTDLEDETLARRCYEIADAMLKAREE